MADIQDNGFRPTINFDCLSEIKEFKCRTCCTKYNKREVKYILSGGHQFWYTDTEKFFCDEDCATEYCNATYDTNY